MVAQCGSLLPVTSVVSMKKTEVSFYHKTHLQTDKYKMVKIMNFKGEGISSDLKIKQTSIFEVTCPARSFKIRCWGWPRSIASVTRVKGSVLHGNERLVPPNLP